MRNRGGNQLIRDLISVVSIPGIEAPEAIKLLKDFIDQVSGVYASCLDSTPLSDFCSVWYVAQTDLVRFEAQINDVEATRTAFPSIESRGSASTSQNLRSYP